MRYVTLPGTDLNASVLGMGCASIMGRVGRQEARKSLVRAYDYGINYFDIARSYGYGEAEEVLGEFLRGRRDDVIVATKVGLKPPAHRGLLHAALPIARKVMSWLPQRGQDLLRSSASQSGVTAPERRFSVPQVRKSLEKSLQALNTDYVDILLLHNCQTEDLEGGELEHFLKKCVNEGKIRYYGLATDVNNTKRILDSSTPFDVVQFANNIYSLGMKDFGTEYEVAAVTHSPLSRGISLVQRIAECAKQRPDIAREWSSDVGLDMCIPSNIVHVLLSYAFSQNESGVVLCSMLSGNHLSLNVGTAKYPIVENSLENIIPKIQRYITK